MQKKSLTLIACMILSAIMFCSCGTSYVKEVEKDPTQNVVSAFKASYADIDLKTLDYNSLTFSVNPDASEESASRQVLTNEGKIQFYNNTDVNHTAIVLAGIKTGTSEIDANIQYKNGEFCVGSDFVLGEEMYGVNLGTLYEDLENWELWDELGVSFEDVDQELKDSIQLLSETIDNPKNIDREKLTQLVDVIDECVSSVEYVNENGSEYVVVKYVFDTQDIETILDRLLTMYNEAANVQISNDADLITAKSILDDMQLSDYTISVAVQINAESKAVSCIELAGDAKYITIDNAMITEADESVDTVEPQIETVPVSFSLACNINKNKNNSYSLVCSTAIGNETTTMSGVVAKNDNGAEVEYNIALSENDETIRGTLVINKSNKTFEIAIDVINLSLRGEYEASENDLLLTIREISAPDALESSESIAIDLDINLERNATVEFPESYMDITDLSYEEIQDIFMHVYGSVLAN